MPKALGAKSVSFFTAVGSDTAAEFVRAKLDEYQVNAFCFVDETRPTTLKKRYRVGNKTLLRVNEVKDHDIERNIQNQIWKALKKELKDATAVIFSDFNYGLLPQTLVDKLTDYCIGTRY